MDSRKLKVYKQGYVENYRARIRFFHTNNVMKNIINKCDCIVDLTEGDSFTDIYGDERFITGISLKNMIVQSDVPLVLGPQTYGPFKKKHTVELAKHVFEHASLVVARDKLSEDYIKELYGIPIVSTTDLAFSLPYHNLQVRDDARICVGINISALLVKEKSENTEVAFELRTDYDEYVETLLEWFRNNISRYRVILIPHVVEDVNPIENLLKKYPEFEKYEFASSPISVKNFISSMDIFIGSRMHATIAAVSSGVATIPVGYSRKFRGLFDSIEYPYNIDLQNIDTIEAINQTVTYVQHFSELKECLKKSQVIINANKKKNKEIFADYLSQITC